MYSLQTEEEWIGDTLYHFDVEDVGHLLVDVVGELQDRLRRRLAGGRRGLARQCQQDVVKQLHTKCTAVREVASPLREPTCHMGSHSVTRHPAEVTFPPLPQPKLVLD